MFGLDAASAAALLALGVGVGFLAGLLGIGGGMLMVPFLTLLLSGRGVAPQLAVKMAIATSMATILFTSVSSLRTHHAHGAVRWALVRTLAPGIVAGGLLAGAGAFALLKGRALALVFALFIGYTALRMLWRGGGVAASARLPGPAGQLGVGTGIGFASGLLGAGGAFLSVPFMTRCGVPLREAVGTAAALGLPIAVASVAGYLVSGWRLAPALPGAFGYLYLPALAVVAVASTALAPWGARTAHRIDVALLRRLFAVLMLLLGGRMLFEVWSA